MELQTVIQAIKRSALAAGLMIPLTLGAATAFAASGPTSPDGAMMDQATQNGHSGMMMPGMPMNGEMSQKMTKMMDECNNMMGSMTRNRGGAPAEKS
jgi:Spy/CpxP family protein refolding chaperone